MNSSGAKIGTSSLRRSKQSGEESDCGTHTDEIAREIAGSYSLNRD